MEKILKQITSEFKDVKEDNFITLSGLLNLIINNSNSKINIQLLTKKISEYKDLENVRCEYTTLLTRDDPKEKAFQKLNESLTLYNILNFIKKALDIGLSGGNLFFKSKEIMVLDSVEGGYIIVSLNSQKIYVLISIILDEFNLLQSQLKLLEEKSEKLELCRFDYRSNAVKGYSCYFSVKNFYVNKLKKEIIVIEVYSDNRDNYNSKYYEVELEILNKLMLESDKFNFKDSIKQNEIKEIDKLSFFNRGI